MAHKKVKHMHIELAENGFMATTQHERTPEDIKKGLYDYDSGTEKTVHATPEDLANHVRKTFGGTTKNSSGASSRNNMAKKTSNDLRSKIASKLAEARKG